MTVRFIPKYTSDSVILGEVRSFEEAFLLISKHCEKFSVRFTPDDIALEYEKPFGKYILDADPEEKVTLQR